MIGRTSSRWHEAPAKARAVIKLAYCDSRCKLSIAPATRIPEEDGGGGWKEDKGGESELSGWRTRLRWPVIKCSQVTVASPAVITSPSRERRSSPASPWRGDPSPWRRKFLHGTFLPPPPPSSLPSASVLSVLPTRFSAIPVRHLACRRSCRVLLLYAAFRSDALSAARASFNEKLISGPERSPSSPRAPSRAVLSVFLDLIDLSARRADGFRF